jgi:hypothetical protein
MYLTSRYYTLSTTYFVLREVREDFLVSNVAQTDKGGIVGFRGAASAGMMEWSRESRNPRTTKKRMEELFVG